MENRHGMSRWLTGCLCGAAMIALASPVLTACSGNDGPGQAEVTDGSDATATDATGTAPAPAGADDGVATETEHELAPGEISLKHKNLTEDMIPSVPSPPENVTQESIKKAVLAIVADRIPDIAVESVDLLGSRTSDFPNGGGSEMWASYLVRVGGNNDDIGIEVVCSSEVLPIAKVKDILRVDETQSYDVRNRKYIMSDDIPDQGQQDPSTPDSQSAPGTAPQAEPLRNQVNPDDPYTYYDSKGNLQPLSESSLPQVEKRLSYDDKGNPIWIYGSEDLG